MNCIQEWHNGYNITTKHKYVLRKKNHVLMRAGGTQFPNRKVQDRLWEVVGQK